ncbi:MAG TPA: protein-methionine-sulfoxide reductase heme-binding subunit MsrQ [Vicinamibacterales bacterium]|nr:protein-methionine-sulfoxide reductase heme-binding subunit MsrQ [Vicinamibacterales bacterium]
MLKLAKPLIFAIALAPFLWLATRALTGRLSANPIEDITLTTGIWTLRFLVITLAITPLRRITGWNRAIQYRRMLGLFAFFYAVLHVSTYVVLDLFFAWDLILADIAKRPFITAGMVAFVAMIPLALTSTKGWIRRLGRRWQLLHRLIYLSAIAAAVHYLWKVKVMVGSPVYYAAIIAALLLFRAVWGFRHRRRTNPQPAEA